MPLTEKGEEIRKALTKEYGPKAGERVLYAGENKGTFTGIHDRRARLHAALDRLLDCTMRDSVMGQVEQSVRAAAPKVTSALTTEPHEIGDRATRLHASLDRMLDGNMDWVAREAQKVSENAARSGKQEDHLRAAKVCKAASDALFNDGDREKARYFMNQAAQHEGSARAAASDGLLKELAHPFTPDPQ